MTEIQGVAYLRGTDGSAEYTLLPANGYVVGRMPSVAIPIRGSSASRLHAVIAGDGRRWVITDHSSNGTLVNDRLISRHSLQHGDRIRFTETSEFEFTLGEIADQSTCAGFPKDDSAPMVTTPSGPLLIGTSKLTASLRIHIAKAALTGRPVVVRGERGTGKRLVAASIHAQSPFRLNPNRSLDCATLSAESIRQLFDPQIAPGARETLVLVELLNLSSEAQEELYQQLRGSSSGSEDQSHRFISTSTRSPEEAIESGAFMADLFNRLGIVQILIDPLRHRPQDIPDLATYFARQAGRQFSASVESISEGAAKLLQEYSWPGNAVELRNVVERAVLFCDGTELEPKHLLAGFHATREQQAPYEGMSLDEVEHHHIQATLDAMNWVKLHVADVLKIERSTLDRKIKKYNLVRRSTTTGSEEDCGGEEGCESEEGGGGSSHEGCED